MPITPCVQTGVERFLTPELLTGDERWECTSCGDRQEALTSTLFTNVPDVLFLQLRRFTVSSCGIVKDRSRVQPSNLLTIPVLDSVSGNTDNVTFRVLSTIHHSGDFEGGHYFSCINSEGQWYQCNDSLVTPMLQRNIPQDTLYVLVYIRN